MQSIDPNIVVALIAATVTLIGYFITRYLEKKKLIEQQIREQKLPVYQEFIDFIFEIFQSTKKKKELDIDKLGEFYWKMNKMSILWLSDRTFKSYSTWKDCTSKAVDKHRTKKENLEILYMLENLLFEIRKDIGHENKNLVKGDILKLFINDWSDFSN